MLGVLPDPACAAAPSPDAAAASEGAPISPGVSTLPVAFRPTPGTYLRMRREAAGLSLLQVSLSTIPEPGTGAEGVVALPVRALIDAEADRAPLGDMTIGVVSRVVPLAREIYAALRDDLPVTPICKGCACSWFDPCHREGRPCAWTDSSATECTACAAKEPL